MAMRDHLKLYSLDHIFNLSFDKELQVLGVELVGYDPISGALKRVTVNALGEYATNDIEEVGTITYIGKEDPAGEWFIQKVDQTSGTSIRYATVKNNPTYTTYSDGWTNRATLTYNTYSGSF